MKVEKIAICLLVIGLILKFAHLSGGGILMTIAACGLSLLYLVFSFLLFKNKATGRKQTILSTIAGLILSIAPLAILFKLQYWPGAALMLIEYTIASAVLILIVLALRRKQEEELVVYYRQLLVRLVSYSVVCVALYLTPSRALLRMQYWNDPEFAEKAADYYTHPENEEYRKRYEEHQKKRSQ